MYGGNDKSLAEIAAEVKKTVVGQDEAVDWLCTFVDAACARSRIIHEQGIDSLSLPNVGSALIVGRRLRANRTCSRHSRRHRACSSNR
ncbi:MAG: hypothetical protein ACLTQI_04770 [Slackia sp.]